MSITVTTSLLANQVPGPVVPFAPIYRGSSTATTLPTGTTYPPFIQGNSFSAISLNRLLCDLANTFSFGGNGYCITYGLGFNQASGLTVNVSPGTAIGPGPLELLNGGSVVVPNNTARVYIWLLTTGAVGYATSLTPPTHAACYLFSVVTSGGNVTQCDNAGAVYNFAGRLQRRTGDRSIPSDTPSIAIETLTQSGLFHWNGSAHVPVGVPVLTMNLSADLTMNALDTGCYGLNPNGANRVVLLPSAPNFASFLNIVNSASLGSNTITVKDPTGAITICTLTNGQQTGPMYPSIGGSSSATKYPTGAITPR